MGNIYLITNTVNNKKYVGQTSITIKKRWLQHINNALNTPNRGCVLLYSAIRKYGKDKFNLTILETTDNSLLNTREAYWIEFFESNNITKGYNLTTGGDHFKMSDSCKKKLSDKLKGRIITWKDKTSIGVKKLWKDPIYREKQIEQRKQKRGKYKIHTKPLRLALDVKKINELYSEGLTINEIAKKFNVCWYSIDKRINK